MARSREHCSVIIHCNVFSASTCSFFPLPPRLTLLLSFQKCVAYIQKPFCFVVFFCDQYGEQHRDLFIFTLSKVVSPGPSCFSIFISCYKPHANTHSTHPSKEHSGCVSTVLCPPHRILEACILAALSYFLWEVTGHVCLFMYRLIYFCICREFSEYIVTTIWSVGGPILIPT